MTNLHGLQRRHFMGASLAAAALTGMAGSAKAQAATPDQPTTPKTFERKIKIGLIGGGHRGNFVGDLMVKHGGYEIAAVCDYFPAVAKAMGEKYGVPEGRRFSGLAGYKRMLGSGAIEAIGIFDVPYFYPEQLCDAVDAGVHAYMAKPVAVDVPGTLLVGKKAAEATAKSVCVLVDYQLPLDPANAEVIARIRAGGLGRLTHLISYGKSAAWADPPYKGNDISCRLQKVVWLSDTALSGDTIVSYDIHIIDGLMAALGKTPAAAYGRSRLVRPEPHGDRVDTSHTLFEFDDGATWSHVTQSLNNNADFTDLSSSLYGDQASARLSYNREKIYVRGGPKHYAAEVSRSIYVDGASANVAEFYASIVGRRFENATVARAVQGHLTCILGREASARGARLTMDDVIKENKRLEANLKGLAV